VNREPRISNRVHGSREGRDTEPRYPFRGSQRFGSRVTPQSPIRVSFLSSSLGWANTPGRALPCPDSVRPGFIHLQKVES